MPFTNFKIAQMKGITDMRVQYKIWNIVICIIILVLCIKKMGRKHAFVEEKYDFFRNFLLMMGSIPSAKAYEKTMAKLGWNIRKNLKSYNY